MEDEESLHGVDKIPSDDDYDDTGAAARAVTVFGGGE